MCDPSMLGMATQGVGAAGSALGSYFAASGRKLALNSDAAIQDLNARLAESDGRLARQQGEQAQVAQKLKTGQIAAKQRVAAAAGGVDATYGTPLNTIVSTEVMGEIDALTIDANAIRAQGNRQIEATGYRNKANTDRANARSISPFGEAAISLLGNGASILDKYAGVGISRLGGSGAGSSRGFSAGGSGASSGMASFGGIKAFGGKTLR